MDLKSLFVALTTFAISTTVIVHSRNLWYTFFDFEISTMDKESETITVNDYDEVGVLSSSTKEIHVLILVHGIMGNHKELEYLKKAIVKEVTPDETSNEVKDTFVVVHSARSNDHNTLDGIAAGGIRLAREINELICQISARVASTMSENDNMPIIKLSTIGFSLGGMYMRYALPYIAWGGKDDVLCMTIDNSSKSNVDVGDGSSSSKTIVEPHLFVTSATPHLGTQKQTFVKLPRFMERVSAASMKQTGSDLFRFTDVIDRMNLDDKFLQPLGAFKKRIAYANAYGTDFPVSITSAAFLHDAGSSHLLFKNSNDDYCEIIRSETDKTFRSKATAFDDNSICSTERTTQTANSSDSLNSTSLNLTSTTKTKPTIEFSSYEEAMTEFSKQLDSLGWTKIFLDVRLHVPKIGGNTMNKLKNKKNATFVSGKRYNSSEILKSGITSYDLTSLPVGHSMLVASSKNKLYKWFYKGGRPVADKIAKEFIREVINSSPISSSTQ